jgi:ABC-type sugar transport system ATPase subunit
MDPAPDVASLEGITKRFGRVAAVEDVTIRFRSGEAVGLVGDNGAGKSTLMKILSGAVSPDGGAIRVRGEAVKFRSPREARARGVEMIYQDLALVDSLSVVANVFLGRETCRRGLPGAAGVLDEAAMETRARTLLSSVGVDPALCRRPVEELSGGERQAVAIGRSLAFASSLVILDEPTAALSILESRRVLDLVRRLKAAGTALALVTHKLDEVFAVCDRIVVLFHGRVAADTPVEATDRETVTSGMFEGAA